MEQLTTNGTVIISLRNKHGIAHTNSSKNAQFIVKACNSYENLLNACQLALDDFELEGIELNSDTIHAIRKALGKV